MCSIRFNVEKEPKIVGWVLAVSLNVNLKNAGENRKPCWSSKIFKEWKH